MPPLRSRAHWLGTLVLWMSLFPAVGFAQTAYRWSGAGASGAWSDPKAWTPNGVPGTTAGDSAVIDGPTNVTLSAAPVQALASLHVSGGATLTLQGSQWTLDVTIAPGEVWIGGASAGTVIFADDRADQGLALRATTVSIASNGTVHSDGRGAPGGGTSGTIGGGPGGGPTSGAGGGHGGLGGTTLDLLGGAAYGSLLEPTTFGSGGGSRPNGRGGAGGGRIRLRTETLRVEGVVSASGAAVSSCGPNGAGGGSGGAIWISTRTFQGSGVISARGGNSSCGTGGGGGGRIAVDGFTSLPGVVFDAHGGEDNDLYAQGGAGTVALTPEGRGTSVVLDNASTRVDEHHRPAPTPLGNLVAETLTLRGNASVRLKPGERIVLGGALVVPAGQSAWVERWGPSVGNPNTGGFLSIQAASAQIAGVLNASASGAGGNNASDYGPGEGGSPNAGGGGHGGPGGAGISVDGSAQSPGGGTYGSLTAPVQLGSGGGCWLGNCGGRPGGGALELEIAETLDLTGELHADGEDSGGGGGAGSGGSVFITANTVSGNGQLSARGGGSYYNPGANGPGGGGGGVITLFASEGMLPTSVTGGVATGVAGTRGVVTQGLRLAANAPLSGGGGSGYLSTIAVSEFRKTAPAFHSLRRFWAFIFPWSLAAIRRNPSESDIGTSEPSAPLGWADSEPYISFLGTLPR